MAIRPEGARLSRPVRCRSTPPFWPALGGPAGPALLVLRKPQVGAHLLEQRRTRMVARSLSRFSNFLAPRSLLVVSFVNTAAIGEASGEVVLGDLPFPHVPVLVGPGQRQRPWASAISSGKSSSSGLGNGAFPFSERATPAWKGPISKVIATSVRAPVGRWDWLTATPHPFASVKMDLQWRADLCSA